MLYRKFLRTSHASITQAWSGVGEQLNDKQQQVERTNILDTSGFIMYFNILG